ncbi:MAG TPA: serine/threonine-protein kinase, partial [Thermoanaerobaculia bacterium]|nr:serine/threonine-protein kinase [Thermoanaerobaculia bacterium]
MPTTRNLIGQDIGRYRIVSFLGSGGMGEVYDAIDSSLGRHVALKLLISDSIADPKRLRRFEQEARTASALNHPHLISIYEIGEDAGVHFIAMERVDGSTLRQIFSSERLPFRRALDLMAQITDAIAAAHSAGIIHRDLKPENIMVSHSGYAKVLDFGLAKLQVETVRPADASGTTVSRATAAGTILGTVGYMSPEQALGKPADARSDIFSLGCILYEAIGGRRAFHAASLIDTLHQIIHEEPLPLGDIAPNTPAEALRIVRKAMAKDPQRRYQSAEEVAIDLRDAANAVESVPRTSVAPLRAPRPDRRARKAQRAI